MTDVRVVVGAGCGGWASDVCERLRALDGLRGVLGQPDQGARRRREDPKHSVVSGLLTSGRVIAAAATIMGFGFGSFVLNGDPTVKPFGIGLALAVILDATAVRCLLVPARTDSLGKANWYLPRWLGQILPRISIECEKYVKPAMGSRPQSSSKPSRSRRRGRSRWPPHRRDDCPS